MENTDRIEVRGEVRNNEKSTMHQCILKIYICVQDLKMKRYRKVLLLRFYKRFVIPKVISLSTSGAPGTFL